MYKSLYKQIIVQAKTENRIKNSENYYEKHHIIPEFMFTDRKRKGPAGHLNGNPDSPENLVLLTFREHLMCHYYLFEIFKETRYEYQTGAALQFFFIKATGGHQRQRNLSEIDEKFLTEMDHIRQLGIKSISNARSGKMPVVDVITREKMGSVSVNHPKVLSGEWVHHSKGIKQTWEKQDQSGSNNNNFKEMTRDRKQRVFSCVGKSLVDERYLSCKIFLNNIKKEFTEFKKISLIWIKNNFGNIENLIEEYNIVMNSNVIFEPYYRSLAQRKILSEKSSDYRWVNNGFRNIRLKTEDLQKFLEGNSNYSSGKIK
jgi:hypothetical protein